MPGMILGGDGNGSEWEGRALLQGFRSPEEVQRFSDMMDEMCYIVATKHSGSLKVLNSSSSSSSQYLLFGKLPYSR